jgi:hypothetical protein
MLSAGDPAASKEFLSCAVRRLFATQQRRLAFSQKFLLLPHRAIEHQEVILKCT